jgi:hypothetical protein
MASATEKETTFQHRDDDLQDVDAAVQLAHEVDETVYSPWTATMFRLYAALTIAYLCGCLNGYDGSLMGGLNGMTSYQKFFNMKVAGSGTGLGMLFAVIHTTLNIY